MGSNPEDHGSRGGKCHLQPVPKAKEGQAVFCLAIVRAGDSNSQLLFSFSLFSFGMG